MSELTRRALLGTLLLVGVALYCAHVEVRIRELGALDEFIFDTSGCFVRGTERAVIRARLHSLHYQVQRAPGLADADLVEPRLQTSWAETRRYFLVIRCDRDDKCDVAYLASSLAGLAESGPTPLWPVAKP